MTDVRAERLNSPNAKVRRIAELEVEVERLRKERDHARFRWDEYERLAELTASDLNDAEAEIERLRKERVAPLVGSSDPCDIAHTYERDPE